MNSCGEGVTFANGCENKSERSRGALFSTVLSSFIYGRIDTGEMASPVLRAKPPKTSIENSVNTGA